MASNQKIDFLYPNSGMDKFAYRHYMIKAWYRNRRMRRILVLTCELSTYKLALSFVLPDLNVYSVYVIISPT